MSKNTLYVICNLNGEYWTGSYWSRSYSWAREFSKGAAIACMRQLKKMGYNCYYDRA